MSVIKTLIKAFCFSSRKVLSAPRSLESRLPKVVNLWPVIEQAQRVTQRSFTEYKFIETGYEDVNLHCKSPDGDILLKILEKSRSSKECQRLIAILGDANKVGIPTQCLFGENPLQEVLCDGTAVKFLCLSFIHGTPLNELPGGLPSAALSQLVAITQQIQRISVVDIYYDSWAILNFKNEYAAKRQYLDPDEVALIDRVAERFLSIDVKGLPHTFVHGDLIEPNLIWDEKEQKLSVIDFSIGNPAPRIVELAVILTSTLQKSPWLDTPESYFIESLDTFFPVGSLHASECDAFPWFVAIGHAMHIIGARYHERALKTALNQNEFWRSKGVEGLSKCVSWLT
jgi:Ser/Thr protein kinase RdoA (MazF antagonist)